MDYYTFSEKFTPYGWFPDLEFFLFIGIIPIVLLVVKAYKIFLIQAIMNIWYTGWIYMAGWDFYTERAQANVIIFVIICMLYLVELVYVVLLVNKKFRTRQK